MKNKTEIDEEFELKGDKEFAEMLRKDMIAILIVSAFFALFSGIMLTVIFYCCKEWFFN